MLTDAGFIENWLGLLCTNPSSLDAFARQHVTAAQEGWVDNLKGKAEKRHPGKLLKSRKSMAGSTHSNHRVAADILIAALAAGQVRVTDPGKPFAATVEISAVKHSLEYGRQIIDGKVAGVSLKDLNAE